MKGDCSCNTFLLSPIFLVLCMFQIPSQRCFALQLLCSVLNKCTQNLQCKDHNLNTVNVSHLDRAVDWQAIWAYALGPELEMALSLR